MFQLRIVAQTFNVVLIVLSSSSSSEADEIVKDVCDKAKQRCESRVGCGMALNNVYISCQSVYYGNSSTCTPICSRAIATLLLATDNDGLEFLSCDCESSTFCADRMKGIKVCEKAVIEAFTALNQSFELSCNLVRWICEKDNDCKKAFMKWRTHCNISGDQSACTSTCTKGWNMLRQLPIGANVVRCICPLNISDKCNKLKYCLVEDSSGPTNTGHQFPVITMYVLACLTIWILFSRIQSRSVDPVVS
mgnify:CR=1 FL=1